MLVCRRCSRIATPSAKAVRCGNASRSASQAMSCTAGAAVYPSMVGIDRFGRVGRRDCPIVEQASSYIANHPVLSRVPGLRHRLPQPAAEPIGTSVSAIFFSAVAVVGVVILRFAWSRRQSCSAQRPRERITSPHTRGRTRSADAAVPFFVSELQRLTVAIAGCR